MVLEVNVLQNGYFVIMAIFEFSEGENFVKRCCMKVIGSAILDFR